MSKLGVNNKSQTSLTLSWWATFYIHFTVILNMLNAAKTVFILVKCSPCLWLGCCFRLYCCASAVFCWWHAWQRLSMQRGDVTLWHEDFEFDCTVVLLLICAPVILYELCDFPHEEWSFVSDGQNPAFCTRFTTFTHLGV